MQPIFEGGRLKNQLVIVLFTYEIVYRSMVLEMADSYIDKKPSANTCCNLSMPMTCILYLSQ